MHFKEQEQQRVAVWSGNGRNSFLVARWRPPRAAAYRVHRRSGRRFYFSPLNFLLPLKLGATLVLRQAL